MRLREAQPRDAIEVARVHVRSWQVAYRGLLPDEYLSGLRPEDRAERYTFGDLDPDQPATIVATDRGAICGFATTGPSRDDDLQGSGELLAIYVDPDRWGLGIGRVLMQAARARLARQGFETAGLWVLLGNERAERFYRIDGWIPDGARRRGEVWGVGVQSLRYSRSLP